MAKEVWSSRTQENWNSRLWHALLLLHVAGGQFYQLAACFACGRLVLRLLCCFRACWVCASTLITCTI